MVDRAEYEERLRAVAERIAAHRDIAEELTRERDAVFRPAVDAGVRIADLAEWTGLSEATVRFVLYGRARRERNKAKAAAD